MKKILLILLFFIGSPLLINADFDTSDALIIKGGKTTGTVVGGAVGATIGGVGAGTVAGGIASKRKKEEISKAKRVTLPKLQKSLKMYEEELISRFINDSKNREYGEQYVMQERNTRNISGPSVSEMSPEKLASEYVQYSREARIIKETEQEIKEGKYSYMESKEIMTAGIPSGLGAGTVGASVGLIAGGIAGKKIADIAVFAIVAKKRGVSKNIVKAAYAANVSLSQHKNLLKAAEDGYKTKVINELKTFYNKLFPHEGTKRIKSLINQYNKMPQIIAEFERQGAYVNFADQFQRKIGGYEVMQKFKDAISVSSAVSSLLNKKPFDKVPTQKQKVTLTKQLIASLFDK